MNNDFYIKKAFRSFLTSCILASLGTSIGTFADAIIVGNVIGNDALAVINISMPVYMLYNTIGFTIAIGAGVSISNAVGKVDNQSAKNAFLQAIIAGFALSAICAAFGTLFSEQIILLLGAKGEIFPLAEAYIKPLFFASPLFIIGPIIVVAIRNDADPQRAMISINIYALLNIVLDIIFIYVFNLGISGAAYAIIIGQAAAIAVASTHFLKKDKILSFSFKGFSFTRTFKTISFGISYGLTYLFQMVIIIILNNILSHMYSLWQISVYSVLFSVSMLAFVLFDGIAMAISPLAATYFGEKSRQNIKLTMKYALRFITISSLILSLAIFLLAGPLTIMFGISGGEAFDYSVRCLRIYSFAVIFTCLNYSAISYLQAIERERLALIVSILRGFALFAPASALLAVMLGSVGIALSYAIVEFLVTLIIILLIKRTAVKESSDLILVRDTRHTMPFYETMIDENFTNLGKVVEEISLFCEKSEIDTKKSYFINLIIEELVVKIFEEGFGRVSKRKKRVENYIFIRIMKNEDDVNIHIRDDAVSYNPFKSDKYEDDISELGINMVKNKAKYFDYQRRLVFNNLYIIL